MAVHSTSTLKHVLALNFIMNEIPSGLIDGLNKNFNLLYTPLDLKIEVILNGMIQEKGVGADYNITGNVIIFTKAPKIGSLLLVNYLK